MLFFELEPWGTEVEDHRFGTLASVVANVNRDPKKRSTPYTWDDFFDRESAHTEYDTETNGEMWREFFSPFKKGGA